ncbi:hypothetical protein WJX74_008977 [Apatococcus lobatus]|uniref:Uncharacterized protein n=1 Tax=Apatococcus lobatus TaxID=904363 RepID=A0AAW1S2Z9_9CHLO
MAGGHGVPDYPTGVWSPAGGWHADPKHWKRNTAVALVAIVAICVPVWRMSAAAERRPHAPTRPIPSQMWSKNFPKPDPNATGGSS